jgi:hypothetical protein
MSEIQTTTETVVEIENQVEETTLPTHEEIVKALVATLPEVVTPYGIAKVINGVFKATETDKEIPSQMMYNYSRNGLVVKGKKGCKEYTHEETVAFVTKYTAKYI